MLRLVCLASLAAFVVPAAQAAQKPAPGAIAKGHYVGSASCKDCHEDIYNRFIDSGHPFMLRKAEVLELAGFPLPKGYTWDDMSYVIGGKTRVARYVDRQGYIVTTTKDGKPLAAQYNLAKGTWSAYHPGVKKPYDCGRCHTTGYKPSGHQLGKPGIKGTWKLEGVQCEACHGPASRHVADPEKHKAKVDKSATACAKCHQHGEDLFAAKTIPAKGAFIRHHVQYNELLVSAHQELDCVACHDPHAKRSLSLRTPCASCHEDIAKQYTKKSIHAKRLIGCHECHMAHTNDIAASPDSYVADVRPHLFRINTGAEYSMLTRNGKYAKGELSVKEACLGCHKSRSRDWAAKHATGYHD
jgi:cytochrome c554/c'-like protein